MNEVLVVFCENLLETGLSFVIGGSKLIFFVGQILNSKIVFILGRREYIESLLWLRFLTLSGVCRSNWGPIDRGDPI